MIRLVLVDDHSMFRGSLKALIENESWVEVIGEATNGDDGVELVREIEPDVVLMDLSMTGSNGLEATRRIVSLGLKSRVLVLTAHAEEEYLVPVIDAGASGYLAKMSADQDLLDAIRVVACGQMYLPSQVARLVLQQYRGSRTSVLPLLKGLSGREVDVMTLTAEGFSAREIGDQMLISPKTVDTYRARAMDKLGLRHRSHLVRFVLRAGLLREWGSAESGAVVPLPT